jgi:hypothetical protein
LFQSLSAVASSLDFHAIDTEHLQQIHQHSIDDKAEKKVLQQVASDKNTTTNQHNASDCHHCGHCHGTHAQWVTQQHSQKILLVAQSHHFFYLKTIIDGQVSRLLRPPRY